MIINKFKNLRIEINSDCNRRCVFCPRGIDSTRWVVNEKGRKKLINKHMPSDLVYSILDQNKLQGFDAKVSFIFYNEPTLDERLFDFIDYADKIKTDMLLITNGDKIKKDEKYAKELFKKNISVNISLYDYKDNKGAIKLINFWNNYLDSLKVSRNKYKLYAEYLSFGDRAGLVQAGKANKTSNLYNQVPLNFDCKKIHSKMNIRYDGEVPICCEDASVQYSLGNVNNNSLSEIWYGEKMKIATKILSQGKRSDIKPCNKCIKGRKKVEKKL